MHSCFVLCSLQSSWYTPVTGLDLNGGGLFGPPPVNPSINILRPQVGPSMSRHIGSPAPHQTVKPKPEPSRREAPIDRHGASSSSSGFSHRTSVDIKSEHSANRHRLDYNHRVIYTQM